MINWKNSEILIKKEIRDYINKKSDYREDGLEQRIINNSLNFLASRKIKFILDAISKKETDIETLETIRNLILYATETEIKLLENIGSLSGFTSLGQNHKANLILLNYDKNDTLIQMKIDRLLNLKDTIENYKEKRIKQIEIDSLNMEKQKNQLYVLYTIPRVKDKALILEGKKAIYSEIYQTEVHELEYKDNNIRLNLNNKKLSYVKGIITKEEYLNYKKECLDNLKQVNKEKVLVKK